MTGVSRRQLDYWGRLGLVNPRARWCERFYSFADLVALETIKRLTTHRIPARRLRRAISALQTEVGETGARLPQLRVYANAREVVILPAVPRSQPVEPLTGQFVLQFEIEARADKVRTLASRTAEEWFEVGLAYDSSPETLEKAAEAYRRATVLTPGWVEAQINLGTTLFQLGRIEESKHIFAAAAELASTNPLVQFNLGFVLDQLGDTDGAIVHLRLAI
jgi:DNA-binding transcriptional MerR regulator